MSERVRLRRKKNDATNQHTLQRQDTDQMQASDGAASLVQRVLSSGGQPLDTATRAFMEPRFGHDFSHVRIHTDTQADESAHAVQALAYTAGSNIVFKAGQYAPGTSGGQHLLAHELAHVVQQSAGPVSGVPFADGLAVSEPGDGFERAAEGMAEGVINDQSQDKHFAKYDTQAIFESPASSITQISPVQRTDDDQTGLTSFPPGAQVALDPLKFKITPAGVGVDYHRNLFSAEASHQFDGSSRLSLNYGAPPVPWIPDLTKDVTGGAQGIHGLFTNPVRPGDLSSVSNAFNTLDDVSNIPSKESFGFGLDLQHTPADQGLPDDWSIMLKARLNTDLF